jgi:hypothetical protein
MGDCIVAHDSVGYPGVQQEADPPALGHTLENDSQELVVKQVATYGVQTAAIV